MNYIIKDNEVFEEISNDLFSYYKKVKIPEKAPNLTWNKNKFSWDMWNDIKNICAFTYKEHSSECLIRLYYHSIQDEWKAVFMPQQMSGMTVSDTLDTEILVKECPDGWIEAGSVHHHCSVGASQSGTDEKDEQKQTGIHITLGNINKDTYGIHSRFKTMDGFSNVKLMSFFNKPEWLEAVPEKYRNEMAFNVVSDLVLTEGDPEKAREDWIDRIIPKPVLTNKWNANSNRNSGYYGYGGYNYGQQDAFDLDTAEESAWRRAEKEENKADDIYEDIYYELAAPEMTKEGTCVVAYTTKDICESINISKKEAKKQGVEDLWHTIRERISEEKIETKTISVTGLNKHIINNKTELESQLYAMAQEYEEDDADKMGEENNPVRFI